ncbi:MAG: AMP-binding protein [Neisseriaceae bacterium]|nr:AMP-binding protein [Neisseriaceae bacterium]MBP6861222.1 AMP-binding protein [Neisseriaceae bacterium]
MNTVNRFNDTLPPSPANYTPLTPLTFLRRSALAHRDRLSVIHGSVQRTWGETYARCRQMADALAQQGIGKGDVVSTLLPNVPEMLELHFAVAMVGGVLNTMNTRLDAKTLAYILDHSETKVLFTDTEFHATASDALATCQQQPLVVDVIDVNFKGGATIGSTDYGRLLAQGSADFAYADITDEWQAISLNYTSGTTGQPKGVVYHHRGAHLNALSNIIGIGLLPGSVYLWTLPMFHCNGWCYPWAVAAIAGTSVCLRQPRPEAIFKAIAERKVTHMCAAPIVLNMMVNAPKEVQLPFDHAMTIATGGAAPASATIAKMEALGISVVHLYGLTETYGPSLVCEPQDDWVGLDATQKATKMARQGVYSLSMSDMMVADEEGRAVPKDGDTVGELWVRGNSVMKGYLDNPAETAKAFEQGWFHTGDVGVWYEDGYVQIRDRSKDIIISGGENISSLEVENALYNHPAILEVAVVAAPDDYWGEVPCAFITLKAGQEQVTKDDIVAYCREHLASFKVVKKVVFTEEIPKTSTGKIQKKVLREMLSEPSSD